MSYVNLHSFYERDNNQEETMSLHAKLRKVQKVFPVDIRGPSIDSGNVTEVTNILESLQDDIRRAAIFSVNDTIQDISTSSLSFLSIDFLLGKAILQLNSKSSLQRMKCVVRATESLYGFLRICEALELWKEDIKKDYYALLELEDYNEENRNLKGGANVTTMLMSGEARQAKIARFRLTKSLIQSKSHLSALYSQRSRLGLSEYEIIDGHDEDGLSRSIAIAELNLNAVDAIEEIHNCRKEIEMLEIAMKIEEGRNDMLIESPRTCSESESKTNPHNSTSNRPLMITRVTSDPETSDTVMRREKIRSQMFRPGWNQPTMTLAELGEKERKEAIRRSQQDDDAEHYVRYKPKRYDQLLRDGLEDNVNLVDQSALHDRNWDDWKDENPKGEGNKMGDRGDRNF